MKTQKTKKKVCNKGGIILLQRKRLDMLIEANLMYRELLESCLEGLELENTFLRSIKNG